jgi:hypothetical protein
MELGRPIGGDDKHRDAGVVRLDDRRMQFGSSRTACRHDRRRHAGRQPETEGEEASRTLVQNNMEVQPASLGRFGKGNQKRRRTRPRRHHGVRHPRPHPFVNNNSGERRLHVLRRVAEGLHSGR